MRACPGTFRTVRRAGPPIYTGARRLGPGAVARLLHAFHTPTADPRTRSLHLTGSRAGRRPSETSNDALAWSFQSVPDVMHGADRTRSTNRTECPLHMNSQCGSAYRN